MVRDRRAERPKTCQYAVPLKISMQQFVADEQAIKRFYDEQAKSQPQRVAVLGVANAVSAAARVHAEWRSFTSLVPLNGSMVILELGCGGGRWCELLAAVTKRVVGVDLSSEAIRLAESSRERAGLKNIEYHNSSIGEFEPDGAYDVVYLSGVALYVSDQALEACIRKFVPHLSRDAVFVVRDSLSNRSHELLHPEGYSARYRTKKEVVNVFTTLGFELRDDCSAFPAWCVNKWLNGRLFGFMVGLLPAKVQKYVGELLVDMLPSPPVTPHWRTTHTEYTHEFLVFQRHR